MMLSFTDARDSVRKVGLTSHKEWKHWSKTDRPATIPSRPDSVYPSEFDGWCDWLGYEGRRIKRKKVARPSTFDFQGTDFKSVPGLRRYYVSSDGRVLVPTEGGDWVASQPTPSANRVTPRLMKPYWNKAIERWTIKLTRDNGKQTCTYVHRLVAMAWIPIPQKYVEMGLTPATLTVDHRDENQPHNNHVDNLQWMPRGPNSTKFNRSEKGRAARKKANRTKGRNVIVRCLDDENDVLTYHSVGAFSTSLVFHGRSEVLSKDARTRRLRGSTERRW